MATRPRAGDAVSCGPVWVSPAEMCEARVRGERVGMSVAQVRLLAELIRAEGRVLTRQQLYAAAYTGRAAGRSRAVDLLIFRIRRALGPLGGFIVSVPGKGYRIDAVGLSAAT